MLVDWLVVDRYITTRIRYLPFLLDLIIVLLFLWNFLYTDLSLKQKAGSFLLVKHKVC